MKVWIYTSDDIEDHYPEKVFSTQERANAYYEQQLAILRREDPHFKDFYFYADIVEMEVDND